MVRVTWFVAPVVAARLLFGSESGAEEGGRQLRARLLATPLETDLTVGLRNGQTWKGTFTDITDSTFRLLAEPDKETRKRMRVDAGVKLKKTFSLDDIVALEGAVSAELVERYLVLHAEEAARMKALLTASAAVGFRLLAGAGRRTVILETIESGGPFQYVVPSDMSDRSEKELDESGAEGFRVVPSSIGATLGEPSAVLERGPDDTSPRDYRVLATSREGTLEEELLEAAAQGFRVIGLTTPGQRVVILESSSPPAGSTTAVPECRLLADFESPQLSQQAAEGYRLTACSDGERLCVLEKTQARLPEDPYVVLAAAKISTLEKGMNEVGHRGYRLHPAALGVQSRDGVVGEIFAVMEKTESASPLEYRIVSASRTTDIQKEVGLAAQNGFQAVAMTSETKTMAGTGGLTSVRAATDASGVFVVMERPASK